MDIIKRGTPRREIKWAGTCTDCKSQIECTREELESVDWDQRESAEFGRASCPVCGYGMIFYTKTKGV